MDFFQVELEVSSFSERKPLSGRDSDHSGFVVVAEIEKRFVAEPLRDIDGESNGLMIRTLGGSSGCTMS